MQVSAQFAIYPLARADIGEAVGAAIAAVGRHDLDPEVGPMSSLVVGPSESILAAPHEAFLAVASGAACWSPPSPTPAPDPSDPPSPAPDR
jgi:uncharacterized protein YqgV (UPF0045/DUF77 family)